MTAREYLKGLTDSDLIMLARWYDERFTIKDVQDNLPLYNGYFNIKGAEREQILCELSDRLEAENTLRHECSEFLKNRRKASKKAGGSDGSVNSD